MKTLFMIHYIDILPKYQLSRIPRKTRNAVKWIFYLLSV